MVLEKFNLNESDLTLHIESLRYARIIQRGLLPKKRHFQREVDDHFVLYRPLKIVSGDFYWIGGKNNVTYAAVGDCTGHGVPGAMLSILARNILEYAIMSKEIVHTDHILAEMDKKFIESFYGVSDEYNNDWVDISLIRIDWDQMKLEFSSANRKLLLVSGSEFNVLAGNRFPIGGWQIEKNRVFNRQSLDISKGDIVYIGSDGFQDQLGGNYEKKFSSQRLHELLVHISSHPMQKQKLILERSLMEWQGKTEQIDDICIMGLKI